MQRCGWVSQDPLYIEYHDTEWGVAQKEGRQLFEMICALKKRGFKFVGSTICYSFMQACGLVNDHVTGCFCHPGGQDDPQVGH